MSTDRYNFQQIRRWLKSHHKQHMGTNSERSTIYTAKETTSHKYLLRARIAGVIKPRRLTTHFFWAQENQDIIKALKEEANDEGNDDLKKIKTKAGRKGKKGTDSASTSDVGEGEETSERKRFNGLTSYQALCKSEFEKLDEEEQKQWKEMVELSLSQKSERYTAITKGEALTKTPEFRQE